MSCICYCHDLCHMFIYVIIGPIASILVEKYGYRPVIIAGSLLSSAGFFATIFVPSIWFMYLTFGIAAGDTIVTDTILICQKISNICYTIHRYFFKSPPPSPIAPHPPTPSLRASHPLHSSRFTGLVGVTEALVVPYNSIHFCIEPYVLYPENPERPELS